MLYATEDMVVPNSVTAVACPDRMDMGEKYIGEAATVGRKVAKG